MEQRTESPEFRIQKGEVVRVVEEKITDRSAYFLSHDEAKRLKDAALTYGVLSTTYYALVSLMLNCGLRRAEAINLKIEQVNMADSMIELGTETKTKTPRKIPFSDDLRKSLLQLIGTRKDGYVFMHRTKGGTSERKYSTMQVNNIIGSIGVRAGIKPKNPGMKHVNPHLLRHSWAKFCQRAGMDKNHVRVMGGWRSMKMLDLVYGTPDYESVAKDYREKVNW